MHENAQAQLLAQADSQAHTHLQVALVSMQPKAFLDVVPYGRLYQRLTFAPRALSGRRGCRSSCRPRQTWRRRGRRPSRRPSCETTRTSSCASAWLRCA